MQSSRRVGVEHPSRMEVPVGRCRMHAALLARRPASAELAKLVDHEPAGILCANNRAAMLDRCVAVVHGFHPVETRVASRRHAGVRSPSSANGMVLPASIAAGRRSIPVL